MVEPHETPYVAEIGNDLASMQKAVGGNIQAVDLASYVSLVCNEEDKLLETEGNRSLGNDILVGNFFIAGSGLVPHGGCQKSQVCAIFPCRTLLSWLRRRAEL